MAALLYSRRTRILIASTLFWVSRWYGKLCTVVEIHVQGLVWAYGAISPDGWRHGPLFAPSDMS